MAKLMIPGPCGHEVIEFDPKLVDETNLRMAFTDDLGPQCAAVREAMEHFDNLVKNHKMLAATKNPGDREFTRITDLKDAKEETTFIPQQQGG
jgi:hypothetical protein